MKSCHPILLNLMAAAILPTAVLKAAVQTTSATDSSATASASGDLLETSLSSHNWQANNNINNGTTGAFNENAGANPAKVTTSGTYDFNLDVSANPSGYDISEVHCFTGWTDARAGQEYTLWFSYVGVPGFTQITPSTVSVAASGQSLVTHVSDDSGAVLGAGVDVVRFVVGVNGLGNVWREIDVVGVASDLGVESFSATPTFIGPGEAVTLSWEVGASVNSVSIDQGVGDVTSLTDINGLGSVVLDPGPVETTTYTISAVLPAGVTQSSVSVSVTNFPLVQSFTADAGIVSPEADVTLSWQVTNATTLTLNGVDVSALSEMTVNPVGQETFTLVATNANGTEVREVTLFGISAGEAIISEFVVSNDGSLTDEDGEDSDWIEIHNPTANSASLSGYFLTDDESDLEKWMLPATTLLPGEYLVVFASGKNRALPGSELHTNFSLTTGGEYLALVKPDGVTIATEFSAMYPEQRSGVSYGYDFTKLGFHFFLVPTPGSANGDSILGFVEDTEFTLDRGFYSSPIQVGISSATAGAEIRYTLDGTKPTSTTGFVYTGGSPVNISQTTVLRAAAFKEGCQATNVDTHTYIFPADVIADPIMDTDITQDPSYAPNMEAALTSVPSISVNFAGDLDYTEREVSVEMINFEDGDIQVDAGVERFGGHVTNFAKRSMRFTFRSEYGPGKLDFQLFGGHEYSSYQPSKKVNSFDLRAGNHDMSQRGAYLSNRYADDALLDLGQIAPHGRFVHVYMNGKYWGQYHLREGWDASMFSEYFGGGKEDYEAVDANDHFEAGLTVYDGSGEFWAETETLAAGPQPFTNARSHVDIINEIDFMLLYVNGSCESEFRAGGSETQEVPFKFFLKDADGYLRNPGNRNVLDDGPLDLMRELREEADPDFTMLVADRIHHHFFNDGPLTPAKNIERLQDREDESQLSILTECARWGYRTPASFFSYYDNLTDNVFPGQTAAMIGKFKAAGMYPDQGAPVYGQHGGELVSGAGPTISVSDSNLKVYYMYGPADTNPDAYVHSLDPRLPGGTINPAATMISFSGGGISPVDFVQTGDTWSYLDDGSDQGTAWQGTGFNAGSWSSGPTHLGYGDNDEATTVEYIDTVPGGSVQKNATTYFRKSDINIPDPLVFEEFTLNYVFDDGIAIYVNGEEVERRNLAEDAAYDEFANATSSENQFGSITLASTLFVVGNNTIAVEVHNRTATSTDISFDLELTGNPPNSGGPVSPPVPVTFPGWLLSRSYNTSTSEWSALNAAFFTPEPIPADADNLVVSEFNYHPANPSTPAELAVAVDSDEFEFLEFMNVSNQPVDMAGVAISQGINFTFGPNNILPPGGRMVIVENRFAFEARYGGSLGSTWYGTDSLGESDYGGKLSNGGERILIQDASGGQIQDFTYDDVLPWPPASDGPGFSLVLISPDSLPDHNVAGNWAASSQSDGNPGGSDPVGFAGDPDADDDGDGLSAFLEYVLGSSDSVRGDSTIQTGVESHLVEGVTDDYLTISYRRNLHAVNAVGIEAAVSDDLALWSGVPDVVFVSETDNLDGTSTVVYRSASPISEKASEFIRLRVEDASP